jgi:Na+/H+ antiporter NhaC
MAILYPIAIPATFAVCSDAGLDFQQSMPYMVNVISVVLAAAVFGDHCSPISDTTILSSLASDCNHLDHVKTQMPYAMSVGLVSLLLTFISSWLNVGLWFNVLLFLVGTLILYLVILYFGKRAGNSA